MTGLSKTGTQSVASEVTALFRTKRVSEIRQIESRVRSEAEDKAEALRDLLGTRYKDLLGAADRVVAVRDVSRTQVTEALSKLARSATELREHFLLQSAYAPRAAPDDVERRRQVQALGARLKHIVDTTEALYALLEAGRLYEAAARLAAARRNYDALMSAPGAAAAARFSAVQWRGVDAFRLQIAAAARERLVSECVSPDEHAAVVAALVVLDDGSIVDVVRRFLGARAGAARKELTASNGAMGDRMREVAQLVRATVSSVSLMLHPNTGTVFGLVRSADEEAAVRAMADVYGEKLHEVCAPWVADLRTILESDGRKLLDGVNTPRELAAALTDVESILDDDAWSEKCNVVLGMSSADVFAVFKPVISDRADVVAKDSIVTVASDISASIDNAWSSLKGSANSGKDIWATVAGQAMYRTEASSEMCKPESDNIFELLATAGPVAAVTAGLKRQLGTALDDAKVIAERIPSISSTFNDAVYEVMPQVVDAIQKRIDALVQAAEGEASCESREQYAEQALFTARVAMSLGSSMEIEKAFHFEKVLVGDSETGRQYEKFCSKLDRVSSTSYALWASQVCTRLSDELRTNLSSNLSRTTPPSWTSTHTKKESTDKDHGSMCPRSASVAAMRFSIGACTAASRAGGLALPKSALISLTYEMRQVIFAAYNDSIQNYKAMVDDMSNSTLETEVLDIVFMQMLFDLRFFSNLLGHESEKCLKGLISTLQASIDPVDLASSRQALEEAVSEYASRTGVLFGMFSAVCGARSTSPAAYMTSAGYEHANLVAIAPTVPRFAYLPAPMPSTYSLKSGGAAGLRARAAVEQLRSETMAAANGAGSSRQHEETSVVDYASKGIEKGLESVGRIGTRLFGSIGRSLG